MSLRSIASIANRRNSFFSYGWITIHCVSLLFLYLFFFFIQFSVDGHFGYFNLLVIVNNAIMSVGVQISLQDPNLNFFLDKCPEEELLGHMVILLLFFSGPFILVSTVAESLYTPINSAGGSLSFTPLSSPVFLTSYLTSVRCSLIVVSIYIPWWLAQFGYNLLIEQNRFSSFT